MAVVPVASRTWTASSGSLVSLERPSTMMDGDTVVISIIHPTSAFVVGAGVPAGFTKNTYSNHTGVAQSTMFYKNNVVVNNEPSAWTFTFDPSIAGANAASLVVIRGARVSAVSSASGSGGQLVLPPTQYALPDVYACSLLFASTTNGNTFTFDRGVTKLNEAVALPGDGSGRSMSAGFHDITFVPPAAVASYGATDNNESINTADISALSAVQFYIAAGSNPTDPDPVLGPISVSPKKTGWKFVLAKSRDLSDIAELATARNRKLNFTLNRPGSASFSLRMSDPAASEIVGGETCIKAYRDGVVRWSGPIWGIDESLPSETMNISCVGWQETLNKRLLDPTKEKLAHFHDLEGEQIAAILLMHANDTSPTLVQIGSMQTCFPRGISVARSQSIGQVIQQLSDIENGYDFEVTPDTRRLNIWSKKARDLRDTVSFAYRAGPAHNIKSISRQTSVDKMVNSLHVYGKNGPITTQIEPTSIARYFMQEEQASLAEVTNANILLAYAAAEFAVRSNPLEVYSFAPQDWVPFGPTPRIFDDYEIGDIVSLSANYLRINLDKKSARIFAATISIDDNDNEKIDNLQVVAS